MGLATCTCTRKTDLALVSLPSFKHTQAPLVCFTFAPGGADIQLKWQKREPSSQLVMWNSSVKTEAKRLIWFHSTLLLSRYSKGMKVTGGSVLLLPFRDNHTSWCNYICIFNVTVNTFWSQTFLICGDFCLSFEMVIFKRLKICVSAIKLGAVRPSISFTLTSLFFHSSGLMFTSTLLLHWAWGPRQTAASFFHKSS